MSKNRRAFKNLIFAVYCVFLLWILFSMRGGRHPVISIDAIRERISSSVNLVPFNTIKNYISDYSDGTVSRTVAYINVIGNSLLFLPMGIMLPRYMKSQSTFPFIIAMVIMIVSVECIQLITGLGSLDVDDIILNLAGAMIGYLMWRIYIIFSK